MQNLSFPRDSGIRIPWGTRDARIHRSCSSNFDATCIKQDFFPYMTCSMNNQTPSPAHQTVLTNLGLHCAAIPSSGRARSKSQSADHCPRTAQLVAKQTGRWRTQVVSIKGMMASCQPSSYYNPCKHFWPFARASLGGPPCARAGNLSTHHIELETRSQVPGDRMCQPLNNVCVCGRFNFFCRSFAPRSSRFHAGEASRASRPGPAGS